MRAYESETDERAYTPTNLELSAGADGTALAGAGCVQCADQQVRRLGSMRAGEASSASATFDGTLAITAPSGKQMEVRAKRDFAVCFAYCGSKATLQGARCEAHLC